MVSTIRMSYDDFRVNVLKKPPLLKVVQNKDKPLSCVYFVKFDYVSPTGEQLKLIKIGQSKNLKDRLEIYKQFPKGKLIGIIPCKKPYQLEQQIHHVFEEVRYRIKGACEYFLETEEIKEFISDYMCDNDYPNLRVYDKYCPFKSPEKSEYRIMFEKWRDLWTYQK